MRVVTDVAAASLLPAVVFVAAYNNIVFRNSGELLYHRGLTAVFLAAFGALWVLLSVSFLGVDRCRLLRLVARCAVFAAWSVLIGDALRPWLDKAATPVVLSFAVDALVLTALAATIVKVSFRNLVAVAAIMGTLTTANGVYAHCKFVKQLDPKLVWSDEPRVYHPPPARVARGNVYHIVLDTFQSETFEHLRARRPDLDLTAFTYYSRFNTNYPATITAMSALLHGTFYQPGQSFRKWHHTAPTEGFWRQLADAGVTLSLYPYLPYFCSDKAYDCLRVTSVPSLARKRILPATTIDLWFLSLMPNSVRRMLNGQATTGRGFIGTEETAGFSVTAAWSRGVPLRGTVLSERVQRLTGNQLLSFAQFNQLLDEEDKRPATGQYVFYHAPIPHGPFVLDELCRFQEPETVARARTWREEIFEKVPNAARYLPFATCAMRMVTMLTDRLKNVGHYENALIIVQADHGDHALLVEAIPGLDVAFALDRVARTYQPADRWYVDDAHRQELSYGDASAWRSIAVEVLSSGLLLIKMPGQDRGTDSAVPVQMVDIAPTVLKHFELSTDGFPGVAVQDPARAADRENVFFTHGRYSGAEGFPGTKFSKFRLGSDGWTFVADVPLTDDRYARRERGSDPVTVMAAVGSAEFPR